MLTTTLWRSTLPKRMRALGLHLKRLKPGATLHLECSLQNKSDETASTLQRKASESKDLEEPSQHFSEREAARGSVWPEVAGRKTFPNSLLGQLQVRVGRRERPHTGTGDAMCTRHEGLGIESVAVATGFRILKEWGIRHTLACPARQNAPLYLLERRLVLRLKA